MCVNAYTNQPYCDLPECFAGWMARATPNSGEIFEPRTLKDRIDLSADTRISLPVLFDLETNKSTWLDLALKQEPRWNNVHCNLSGISIMARALSDTRRPNLYELFELHIQARGERVFEVDHADTVFALDRGITPFDLSTITAHWIG